MLSENTVLNYVARPETTYKSTLHGTYKYDAYTYHVKTDQNPPGGTRWIRLRREVIAAVSFELSEMIELRVTDAVGVVSLAAPPQSTLRLMCSTLAAVTVRRHLTQHTTAGISRRKQETHQEMR